MAKFIFKTQVANSTTYTGPSGIMYVSYVGEPFKVDNEQDIAFFKKNPRFEEYGLKGKLKDMVVPKKSKEAKDKLREELDKITNLSEKSKELVVKYYGTLDRIETVVKRKIKMTTKIAPTQQELLINHFGKKKTRESEE